MGWTTPGSGDRRSGRHPVRRVPAPTSQRYGEAVRAGLAEGGGDVRPHRPDAGPREDDVPGEGVPAVGPADHGVAAVDLEPGDPGAGPPGAHREVGGES